MPVNFSNVFYTYNVKTPLESAALNGVDLSIEDGSFTAIVGRTGSGKSTMVQMINALLHPTAGEVRVNEYLNCPDKKQRTKKLYKVRAQAGLVFQFPEYQLFAETVEKDVAFAPKNFGLKDEEALEEAHKALRLVGLDESFDKRSPFELSGGEKRRVAIAGILAYHPSILVVDEPTAGLDPQGAIQMMDLFETVNKAGTTVILVSHDMNIVLRYAKKVFVVEDGKIVRSGEPRSLFFEDIEQYSLERPLLYSFVDDLSKRGFDLDTTKILNVDTLAAEIIQEGAEEMKFSLGRYVPYDSPIHRVDPRAKLLGVLLLMITIFFPFQSWAMTYAVDGVIFLLLVVLLYMTRTKITDILRSLKSLWFMIIFLLLIYCLIPTTDPTFPMAFQIKAWNWAVYWDSFLQAGKILLRLMMMIELTMVLTSSTKPLDLTFALEWYMSPLKAIRFPAHEIAMTISIAIRFIPTLLEDTNRIMKSQESRGVSFSHGAIYKRVVSLTSLIIPLFVSAFMRSDELANAMECRGYDPRGKRTRYRMLKAKWYDWAFVLFCMAVFGVLLWFSIDPRFNALLKFPPEI